MESVLAQEDNTMTPANALIRTAQSGVKGTRVIVRHDASLTERISETGGKVFCSLY